MLYKRKMSYKIECQQCGFKEDEDYFKGKCPKCYSTSLIYVWHFSYHIAWNIIIKFEVFSMIKHKALAKAITSPEQEFYLCNQAVTPNEDKLVYRWDKVTCKNCLKQKPQT